MKKLTNLFLVLLIVLLFSQSAFADEQEKEGWEFMLTPYLWAPGINATIGAGPISVPVHVNASDIFGKLKFGGLIHFGMKKGRWGVLLDYMYVNVGEDGKTVEGLPPLLPRIEADYRFSINMFEFAGTYRVAGTRTHGLDAIVGLRYISPEVELAISGSGPMEKEYDGQYKKGWTDLMLGGRYNVVLARKWALAVRSDIGVLSSEIAFNIMALLNFRLSRTVDIFLMYRYLNINYEDDQEGKDYFKFDGYLNGPALGINFRFGKRL